jgi:hypothetical protein
VRACYLFSLLLFAALLSGKTSFSQEIDDDDQPKKLHGPEGFHVGLYTGVLFANKYPASTYDGYGFDINGVKNNFENSIMKRRILYDYGGGNNFPDQIAPAIGVAHGDWFFDSTDMPLTMRYNIAFLFGLDTKYTISKKSSFIMNLQLAKLTAHGDFTITKVNYNTSQTSGPQGAYIYEPFGIIGTEQRMILQVGYQYLFGEKDSKVNFFLEGGPDLTIAKYDKNLIEINSLHIDLTQYYSVPLPGYSAYRPKNLTGFGFGVFTGMGWNLNTGGKWSVQFLYSPSYDLLNIGDAPERKLQHGLGFRAYYVL